MFGSMKEHLSTLLDDIRNAGLYKSERVITSPQRARIGVLEHEPVLNLCANNYLGLADNPEVIAAAHEALDRWGYGLASVRFICGTQELHKQLEQKISGIFFSRWGSKVFQIWSPPFLDQSHRSTSIFESPRDM